MYQDSKQVTCFTSVRIKVEELKIIERLMFYDSLLITESHVPISS